MHSFLFLLTAGTIPAQLSCTTIDDCFTGATACLDDGTCSDSVEFTCDENDDIYDSGFDTCVRLCKFEGCTFALANAII